MTIDAAALREHTETDLGDDAIDRLIADAYEFCALRAGPAGEQTVVMRSGDRYLVLPAAVSGAADIELSERFGDQVTVLVQDTDWRWLGGRTVERLSGGSVVFWGHQYGGGDVLVTFTPKDDEARRDRVVLDLCKLAIQYSALSSEKAGDYSANHLGYAQERERIVRQLAPGLGVA